MTTARFAFLLLSIIIVTLQRGTAASIEVSEDIKQSHDHICRNERIMNKGEDRTGGNELQDERTDRAGTLDGWRKSIEIEGERQTGHSLNEQKKQSREIPAPEKHSDLYQIDMCGETPKVLQDCMTCAKAPRCQEAKRLGWMDEW
jgi:hypothetical protein